MATCQSVVKHYGNFSEQQLTELWNHFNKRGPSVDILREILMYYIHHKNFPPVMQKSCDTLLNSVNMKHVSKKLKNIMFQIMEEIGACLENSIVEQVTVTSEKNIHTALFNCILVGGLVPLLDESTVDKLLSFLKDSEVLVEEHGKLLLYLLVIHETCPSLITSENVSRLETLMINWLMHAPSNPVSTSIGLFNRPDMTAATKVDGNNSSDVFTVLTLANTFNSENLLGVHCFSTIREWLGVQMIHKNRKLMETLREYCSTVVEQCFKPARKGQDVALQKAVLCEVLDIMNQLVLLDSSHSSHCLILVKRIQNNIKENFKGDYRDTCIFVRVLSLLLNIGESTGYNSQFICEYFLQEMISRSYTSGLAALDVVIFLVESKHKMKALQEPLLERYFPNILKIIACNPCVVVEEFFELIPEFVAPDTAVEVFHSLIDLPVMSATLCLHQAPVVVQQESSGSMDTEWAHLLNSTRSPTFLPIFNYLMRSEAGQDFVLEKMTAYMNLLHKISNHSIVISCSQIVPLLLEAYFRTVEKWKNTTYLTPIILSMLNRISVLFKTPGYASSVQKCLLTHFKQLFKLCPELIFSAISDLTKYISFMKNYDLFPQLFIHIVYVIGEYSYTCEWNSDKNQHILQYYEVVECLIYGILAQIATRENTSLELLNIACSTLTKLASQSKDQIPRAMLCLKKIRLQISLGIFSKSNEETCITHDRIEELLFVLQHPNIANMLWPSSSTNSTVTSFVRVLSHITDS